MYNEEEILELLERVENGEEIVEFDYEYELTELEELLTEQE